MDFLDAYIENELDTNWMMTEYAIQYMDSWAFKLRKHGFHRTAKVCENACSIMERWDKRAAGMRMFSSNA